VDPDRYLERIGWRARPEPTLEALAGLQRAHLHQVPFEALDPLLGNPVTVEPADAYRKVVDEARGGYCFELNGLFAWLLEELGFEVTLLAARPIFNDGGLAPPFAHLALLVDLERRWLVDVGFGFPFIVAPLDIDERAEQAQDAMTYRVREDGEALVVEQLEIEGSNAYRFTLEPQSLASFREVCQTFSTSPSASFVRHGPVTKAFEDGWLRLTRTRITGERGGAEIDEAFADEAQWRESLRTRFGLIVEGRSVHGLAAGSEAA
jgi:N-hydroxyarylamine O-acetyltransferase